MIVHTKNDMHRKIVSCMENFVQLLKIVLFFSTITFVIKDRILQINFCVAKFPINYILAVCLVLHAFHDF